MKIFAIAAGVWLTVYVILLLYFAFASGKPFRVLFVNALLGLASFLAVDLTARFSGVYLPLNPWTAGTAAGMGLPGVFGLLILRLIF